MSPSVIVGKIKFATPHLKDQRVVASACDCGVIKVEEKKDLNYYYIDRDGVFDH